MVVITCDGGDGGCDCSGKGDGVGGSVDGGTSDGSGGDGAVVVVGGGLWPTISQHTLHFNPRYTLLQSLCVNQLHQAVGSHRLIMSRV